MNDNKTTELNVFDFALIRQGIVELIAQNTISETTALDLLDKLNALRVKEYNSYIEKKYEIPTITEYFKN
jgi:hypothetical protein